MTGDPMKRIFVTLIATAAILLTGNANASPADGHPIHVLSSHSNIDWD